MARKKKKNITSIFIKFTQGMVSILYRYIQRLPSGLVHNLGAIVSYQLLYGLSKHLLLEMAPTESSILDTSATKLMKDKLIIHKPLVSSLI